MERAFTSATILKSTQERVAGIARENGMKVYTAADAIVRGWDLLTDEQKTTAIRTGGDDAEPSDLGPDTDDPMREACRLNTKAARLVQELDTALDNDGKVDGQELRKLLDFLKSLQQQGERVAQASKRAAKRKARAA
jgi:hypothetical protein